jgi:protein-S-isoprenylcysteine O-methyltransferase Ste14
MQEPGVDVTGADPDRKKRRKRKPGAETPQGGSLTPLGRIGAFFFAWRNVLFSGTVILVMVLLRPVPFLGSPVADRWADLAGVLVTLSGQAIRAVVMGFAPIQRGGERGRVHANRLVREGLFAHCRNPLYVGNLLILTGLLIVHGNPWVIALLLPAGFFGYSAIVAAEEAFLRQRFGKRYREYCRTVPRWLPRLKGLRASMAAMTPNWWRILNKEYNNTATWSAGMLAIWAYEVYAWGTLPARASLPFRLSLAAAAVILCWVAIRYLKKTENARARRRGAAAGGAGCEP